MASFQDALDEGKKFENIILDDIKQKKYPLAYRNMVKENLAYYDIVLEDINSNQKKTIECKYDKKSAETGNICIEVGCNGRLSGLLVTTADFWMITDTFKGYLIKTENIRKCIHEKENEIEYKPKCWVKQEDDNHYKQMNMFLIPNDIFVEYCDEVNLINEMKYDCLI